MGRGSGAAALAWAVTWALAAPASGQVRWERSDGAWCDEGGGRGDRDRYCEVRTASLAATPSLRVDGGGNGGVDVEGWRGPGMRVAARVWAHARSEERARELVDAVDIRAGDGALEADGPDTGRRESWGVSYRIELPESTDLDVTTRNGGIGVRGVEGRIRFHAVNGGVRLSNVAGDVRGRTTNGGVHVELDGERWRGAGLDVETTNGGVRLFVPDGYSADLVAGTVNGGFDVDFPVTVRGRIGRRLETTLGEGGPTIRTVTTNGGVRIARR